MNGDYAPEQDGDMTSIGLPTSLKNLLDKLKIHPREPYYQVIQRYLPVEVPDDPAKL